MTVNELWRACVNARKQGYGSREIYVWNDDEGNGLHSLNFEFCAEENVIEDSFNEFVHYENYKPNKYILLG